MPTYTRPAADSTPEQLRFPAIPGYTVRADFTGGERSSDLGAAILGTVDRRIGMIDRLTAAITDLRDARYVTHSLRDLLTQRIFQIACGYEDGMMPMPCAAIRCSNWPLRVRRWLPIICWPVVRPNPVWKMR